MALFDTLARVLLSILSARGAGAREGFTAILDARRFYCRSRAGGWALAYVRFFTTILTRA